MTDARRNSRPLTVIVDNLDVSYRVYGATQKDAQSTRRLILRNPRRSTQIDAVRGVSLVAHEGEAIGLIGRNGSGKSTLLRAIAGLEVPTSGAIYAEEKPALLGVNAALLPAVSGERNVVLGCLALGLTREQIRERYDEIVELAGLQGHMHLPMRTYSSGMAARLRFAIATVTTPRVLLIDEALNTGDAEFRKRSQEKIDSLLSEAGTVFLVSHSLSTVQSICDRAIWLEKGQVRLDDRPDRVIRHYERWTERWQQRLKDQRAAALAQSQAANS